jgi:hypothetical protein
MTDEPNLGLALELRAFEHPGSVRFVLEQFVKAADEDPELHKLLEDVLSAPFFYQQATLFVLLTCWPAFAPEYFLPNNQIDLVQATFPRINTPWETTLYRDVHDLLQGIVTVDWFTSKWILRVQKTCVSCKPDNLRLLHPTPPRDRPDPPSTARRPPHTAP